MKHLNIPIPKLRVPFSWPVRKREIDPIEQEFMQYTQKLLTELHQENIRLLSQSLDELKERRNKK